MPNKATPINELLAERQRIVEASYLRDIDKEIQELNKLSKRIKRRLRKWDASTTKTNK
jgi:hypothetical protein